MGGGIENGIFSPESARVGIKLLHFHIDVYIWMYQSFYNDLFCFILYFGQAGPDKHFENSSQRHLSEKQVSHCKILKLEKIKK